MNCPPHRLLFLHVRARQARAYCSRVEDELHHVGVVHKKVAPVPPPLPLLADAPHQHCHGMPGVLPHQVQVFFLQEIHCIQQFWRPDGNPLIECSAQHHRAHEPVQLVQLRPGQLAAEFHPVVPVHLLQIQLQHAVSCSACHERLEKHGGRGGRGVPPPIPPVPGVVARGEGGLPRKMLPHVPQHEQVGVEIIPAAVEEDRPTANIRLVHPRFLHARGTGH